ncbi:hypothetical protein AO260_27295 [Pseudomonas sp. ABAC21]|nr:hypothetical protein AO260_27295 [Pseudomonas sp. ABAC21]
MTAPRLPLFLMLAGLLGLAGCSTHQPVSLYQLDSGSPAQPAQAAGMAVLLGPVVVADYLQRETLLQRQNDGSLQGSLDGRWAGSSQVAGHLDSQRVVLAPAPTGFTPDVQVLLTITRLDSGESQPAILDAQWRLIDRRGQVRDNRIVHLQEQHAGTTASQVQAQGVLLQQLAQQLSVALKPLANQPPIAEATRRQAPAQAKPAAPEKPKMPMATPIRTDMEVFRF